MISPSTRTAGIENRLVPWVRAQGRSTLRKMVELVAQPDVVSLAGGLPDPELFPAREYGEAVARALVDDSGALQYRPPLRRLKEQVVALMARRGVECRPEQVVLTTGAQQAIDVLCRMFLAEGDEVAFEALTFIGIHQASSPSRSRPLLLDTDLGTGLDVDGLEDALERGRRPSLLYVIPDAHNPLGVSISLEKRRRLVALAERYRLPIVEDDPYGLLSFEQRFEPPLRALESEWVLYVGSFSKILAPGLRLGWIVAPEHLVEKTTVVKEAIDLECSILTQRAVSALLGDLESEGETGFCFDAHLERLRATYAERRDATIRGLERFFPPGCRWSVPGGGMFVWVELPETIDASELFHRAIERQRVAFVPGSALSLDGRSGRSAMRLSFSTLEPQRIESALEALAGCLRDALDTATATPAVG